jgi:hypothetical protein
MANPSGRTFGDIEASIMKSVLSSVLMRSC